MLSAPLAAWARAWSSSGRSRTRWRSSCGEPVRSTNLLERSLEEVRRRTKVIGRFPGETSCLTMAWAVMDLVIAGARGLGLTLPDRHAIAALVAARAVPLTAEAIA